MESLLIEQLAASSTPIPLPSPDGQHDQRFWIVRFQEQDAVDGLSAKLDACAESAARAVLAAREALDLPEVRLLWLDRRHGVVRVTTVSLERDTLHLYLVVAGAVLRELHQAVALEEIQGLPLRYWRILVGPT